MSMPTDWDKAVVAMNLHQENMRWRKDQQWSATVWSLGFLAAGQPLMPSTEAFVLLGGFFLFVALWYQWELIDALFRARQEFKIAAERAKWDDANEYGVAKHFELKWWEHRTSVLPYVFRNVLLVGTFVILAVVGLP